MNAFSFATRERAPTPEGSHFVARKGSLQTPGSQAIRALENAEPHGTINFPSHDHLRNDSCSTRDSTVFRRG